jgi:uncharacterized protein (TIGR02246 family)
MIENRNADGKVDRPLPAVCGTGRFDHDLPAAGADIQPTPNRSTVLSGAKAMRRFPFITTLTLLALLIAAPGVASEGKRKRGSQKAVRKVAATYIEAFNQGDAIIIAALWTPDGDYVGPRGELIKGRDEIQEKFESFFALNTETRLKINITSIRFVRDDVAVVDGITEVTPLLQGPPAEVRATVILVKQGDQWLIESARDTLVFTPSNYDHLKELEWVIGDWEDAAEAGDDVSVRSTCDWTVNKNFIIRKFSAKVKDQLSVAGTQLIGWDSREDVIRSWAFDSTGSFTQGVWKRDRNRWIITAYGVLQDGSEVSATNIVTRIDDDTFTFQSANRTKDGRQEPDIEPIEIRRATLPASDRGQSALRKKPARETILPE